VVLAWDNIEDCDTPSVYGPFNYTKTAQAFIDASENGLQTGDREPMIALFLKEAI
jgi:hypothetical protein